ncbi:MAG: DUF4126 domain-containing protein [Burkholderiales bacterium]
METFWLDIVQWLHSIGLHPDADFAAGVANAAGKMDMPSLLALAAALGWASGFRLYAVVFLVGMMGMSGYVVLPQGLQVLQHPAVLTVSGFMLFMEFFADKIPGFDSLWDLMHSVIRVPAGAALAAAVFFGADNGTMTLLAALLGGTLAATSQAAKTTTRAAINASPEPFTNIGASLVEDGVSVGAVWLAATHPLVFGVLLVVVVIAMWFVTWWLVKFLRTAFRRLSRFLSSRPAGAEA